MKLEKTKETNSYPESHGHRRESGRIGEGEGQREEAIGNGEEKRTAGLCRLAHWLEPDWFTTTPEWLLGEQ